MSKNFLSLSHQKEALRQAMRAMRLAHEKEHRVSDSVLTEAFLSKMDFEKPSIIAGYCAFRGEVDIAALMDRLRAQGHTIVLPIVGERESPLSFRLYEKDIPLVPNSMGILEPPTASPPLDPDILLVPLLAFDKSLSRLGYGAGFYDRTLTKLRAKKTILAIGIAHPYQEVIEVPVGDHDARLDKVITAVNVF